MLGERIANLRKQKGISQEELADVLVTSRQAISKWERGESDPDIGRLKDLAVYFNVSIDYLLGYDMEDKSVNNFIEKIKKCIEENTFVISIDEIRMIVSRNKNNFNLLMSVVEYLGEYYLINRDKEVVELTIQYIKNAILLYQPNNSYNMSLNDLHKVIATAYTYQNKYDLAKKYLIDNQVIDAKDLMSDCEFNLGHYDETEKITSEIFVCSVASLINNNLIQLRLYLRTNREKEALDLADWSIDFIKSVGKSEEVILDAIYVFSFIKASCQKALNIDYSETLKFLKENKDKTSGYRSDSDGLKFYNNQRIIFASGERDIKKDILKEIEELKKGGFKCQNSLDIYNEVYKED